MKVYSVYTSCSNTHYSEYSMYETVPRRFRYKKDAVAFAKTAVQNGVLSATVECPDGKKIIFRPNRILYT